MTPDRILYDVKRGTEFGLPYRVCGLRILDLQPSLFVCLFVFFVCSVLRATHVLPRAKYRSGKRLRVVSNDSPLLRPPPLSQNKTLIRFLKETIDNARFLLTVASGKQRISVQFSI